MRTTTDSVINLKQNLPSSPKYPHKTKPSIDPENSGQTQLHLRA